MKTIGVLGGMSWQSSKFYYEYLNSLVSEQLGGNHSAKVLMSSVNFSEVERFFSLDDWEGLGEMMAEEAKKLEQIGADCLILATNTVHLVSDAIRQAINIPFLHLTEVVGQSIKDQGLSRVALLGTQFTMEKGFYVDILRTKYNIKTILPNTEERHYLQQLIFNELVKGKFTQNARDNCLTIIQRLRNDGAQGVILGCTEFPILMPEGTIDIPSFDTTLLHAKAAIDFALK